MNKWTAGAGGPADFARLWEMAEVLAARLPIAPVSRARTNGRRWLALVLAVSGSLAGDDPSSESCENSSRSRVDGERLKLSAEGSRGVALQHLSGRPQMLMPAAEGPVAILDGEPKRLVDEQEGSEAFTDFVKQFDGSHASHFDVSLFPRDAAHLIYQNGAGNSLPVGNDNFERVTSDPARNWAHDTKTGPRIILPRCQHDCWTMAALLVAKRGIEVDPDQITGIWAIVTRLRCQQAVPIRARGDGFLALCRQPIAPKCIGVAAVWAW